MPSGLAIFLDVLVPFITLRGSMTKQLQATMAAILVISSISLRAQTSTAAPRKTTTKKAVHKKAPVESKTEREIRELREQMLTQQSQIDALKQENADKDAKLAAAQQSAQGAEAAAATASAKADTVSTATSANTEAVSNLSSSVTDLKSTTVGIQQTVAETKKTITNAMESPLAIHYKGVTITPVAFFAAESVYRQRSLNADINTPFNAIPYPGAAQAHTSEYNWSGRQSRLGALFVANPGPYHFTGYVETDFLGAGITSNDNQSNSYVLRQRQIWGQAATNSGFTFTGGQMWSLVTETKTGTDNRTENLPATIDAQYHVGFSWERQPGVRFQQKIGGFTGAVSLEQAEIIYSATNANANFFIGNAGAGGGLYNVSTNYSNNVAPDVVVKVAYDTPHFGHYEIGGLGRWFRDRYYPNQTLATPSAAGGVNNTKVGGGAFANLRFPVTHFADVGIHGLGGTGVGRYGSSQLPDTTVHPDGTLAPIKDYQGLFSLELHPTKNLDLDGYAGAEYAQRTTYLNTLAGTKGFGSLVGYAPVTASNAGCNTETLPSSTGNGFAGGAPYNPGTPANCLGATRFIGEATGEFVYRFYNSPKYGRLQYAMQYSYFTRKAWQGVGGAPKATDNMVFTSFRYYLP